MRERNIPHMTVRILNDGKRLRVEEWCDGASNTSGPDCMQQQALTSPMIPQRLTSRTWQWCCTAHARRRRSRSCTWSICMWRASTSCCPSCRPRGPRVPHLVRLFPDPGLDLDPDRGPSEHRMQTISLGGRPPEVPGTGLGLLGTMSHVMLMRPRQADALLFPHTPFHLHARRALLMPVEQQPGLSTAHGECC